MRFKMLPKSRAEQKRNKKQLEKRSRLSEWYQPTVGDVYAAVCQAKTMLDRIPSTELATAKRQINVLEDTLWQFVNAR